MRIGEQILLALSTMPQVDDPSQHEAECTVDSALNLLKRVYPNFSTLVHGKRVADFGSGMGYQSVALALQHDCSVVGIDSNPRGIMTATERAKAHNVPSQKLSFVGGISQEMLGRFDVVISQNSFEHFDRPEHVLNEMGSLINRSGIILLTFGPPWLAPYGSHMQFFCKVPWLNLLFSEKTVMKVRSHFKSDGATRYEDVESGLNKMTVSKFESIVSSCNLKVTHRNYECVKGMNGLSNLPLLREFFINNVTVILSKAAS